MHNFFPADISYTVALLPEARFSELLIMANEAITAHFPENAYELSAAFPPHLTLFQGGTTFEGLMDIQERLEQAFTGTLPRLELSVHEIRTSEKGFLDLPCSGANLPAYAETVSAVCVAAHQITNVYRPRVISRLADLDPTELADVSRTGSSRTGSRFNPHFSLAQVSSDHIAETVEIALRTITLPQTFRAEHIVLVNSGHQNEKWEVIPLRRNRESIL